MLVGFPFSDPPLWDGDIMLPVSVNNEHFVRAVTMQSSSNNSYPPPDLVLQKLIFPRILFSGVFLLFTDTGIMLVAEQG